MFYPKIGLKKNLFLLFKVHERIKPLSRDTREIRALSVLFSKVWKRFFNVKEIIRVFVLPQKNMTLRVTCATTTVIMNEFNQEKNRLIQKDNRVRSCDAKKPNILRTTNLILFFTAHRTSVMRFEILRLETQSVS